jgi:hypothetical protein
MKTPPWVYRDGAALPPVPGAAPEGGIVATTERSTEELRAMLKEAVYTVRVLRGA